MLWTLGLLIVVYLMTHAVQSILLKSIMDGDLISASADGKSNFKKFDKALTFLIIFMFFQALCLPVYLIMKAVSWGKVKKKIQSENAERLEDEAKNQLQGENSRPHQSNYTIEEGPNRSVLQGRTTGAVQDRTTVRSVKLSLRTENEKPLRQQYEELGKRGYWHWVFFGVKNDNKETDVDSTDDIVVEADGNQHLEGSEQYTRDPENHIDTAADISSGSGGAGILHDRPEADEKSELLGGSVNHYGSDTSEDEDDATVEDEDDAPLDPDSLAPNGLPYPQKLPNVGSTIGFFCLSGLMDWVTMFLRLIAMKSLLPSTISMVQSVRLLFVVMQTKLFLKVVAKKMHIHHYVGMGMVLIAVILWSLGIMYSPPRDSFDFSKDFPGILVCLPESSLLPESATGSQSNLFTNPEYTALSNSAINTASRFEMHWNSPEGEKLLEGFRRGIATSDGGDSSDKHQLKREVDEMLGNVQRGQFTVVAHRVDDFRLRELAASDGENKKYKEDMQNLYSNEFKAAVAKYRQQLADVVNHHLGRGTGKERVVKNYALQYIAEQLMYGISIYNRESKKNVRMSQSLAEHIRAAFLYADRALHPLQLSLVHPNTLSNAGPAPAGAVKEPPKPLQMSLEREKATSEGAGKTDLKPVSDGWNAIKNRIAEIQKEAENISTVDTRTIGKLDLEKLFKEEILEKETANEDADSTTRNGLRQLPRLWQLQLLTDDENLQQNVISNPNDFGGGKQEGEKEGYSWKIGLAILLCIASQFFASLNFVVQEHVFKQYSPHTSAILAVGLEGCFGMSLGMVVLGVFQKLGKEPLMETFYQIANDDRVFSLPVMIPIFVVLVIASSLAGMLMNKNLSASTRVILDCVRNMIGFLLEPLILRNVSYAERFHWKRAECWTTPIGFTIAILATTVYFNIIIVNRNWLGKQEIHELEKEKEEGSLSLKSCCCNMICVQRKCATRKQDGRDSTGAQMKGDNLADGKSEKPFHEVGKNDA